MDTNTPDPIDIHVGRKLKQRRTLLGLSQEKLADALGITFQQVQKYESGANRVGASRLFQIGKVLDVTVSHFFDGYTAPTNSYSPAPTFAVAEDTKAFDDDILTRKETLDVVRAYYAIPNATIRKKMLGMMRAMADAEADDSKKN
ncbi:MAG: helix-turn-helix domain-containing protein [Alphaproteobacteria bacterium]